ncbi:DUF998 domain-containing protein [Nonomuraea sp. NPDC048882]|uniref:DUF998 domain-containing protein n=1 Tax=Nonomuraea sp. NPDC048882 TaxID=3154347 RepID=UPI0033C76F65
MTIARSVWGTLIGTTASAGALAYAHVALPDQTLLSDYALLSGGLAPVLIGMLALAGACLSLAYGLAIVDPARTAATRVLLLAGAFGLMMSGIFPTDPGTSQVGSLSGEIHRWSSAIVFTSLPVAGWVLARGRSAAPRWNAVRAMSVASGVTLAIYLAAHPATITSALINGGAYYGLLERGMVLAEMALLMAMALAIGGGRGAARNAVAPTATTAAEQDRPENPERPEGQERLAA